ncbi:MAG: HAMP domain-containing sensor histidine kinase [Planctomycetia bacterium]|nr:HAMP domain-containing sensor histidine kinase [Planctomycetia bacterium]
MDHFVRALSHDMTANLMLLESSLREVQASCATGGSALGMTQGLAHVEACLQESKRFLDDLVALGQTGAVQMEPVRVELGGVIDEVLFEQQPLFDSQGIQLQIGTTFPTVWCNRNRVKQVLTNLMRNAALHGGDAKAPAIRVEQIDCPERFRAKYGEQAWMRVFDNGPGIPAPMREKIFLPGRRLANAAAEGSGMGLAIVRRVVEHFGGFSGVDEAVTPGTAFLVSFPLADLVPRPDS